jgi:iron uptake system EfeUOB component EfeO/EfeM
MLKSKTALVAAAMLTALSLTACSSTQPTPKPAAPAAEQKSEPKVSIADGTKSMLKELGDLKADIAKGDAAQAKSHFDEAHEAWETFEDDVKAKDKDLYGKIEEQLDVLKAGTKAATLDQKVLSDAVAKLEPLLTPLTK